MHIHPVRVYYEDTDLAGIVYYANYLKFIERGRSEWVRACGIDQMELRAAQDIVFAVRRIEADYLSPARFGEDLEVRTAVQAITGARIVLLQEVTRGADLLFRAVVTLACLSDTGASARLPPGVRARLGG